MLIYEIKSLKTTVYIDLVETAGIEPASANPPLLDLHAYSVFKFSQSATQQTGNAKDDFSNF
jgi:hypothetical protein